jgi:hypothetical protein
MIFEELYKFKDIRYVDSTHEYTLDGVKHTSVTTFIGEYKSKFDTENVAKKYALKHKLDVNKVIEDWDYMREFASMKGRTFHSFAENWYANKIFEYDVEDIKNKWGNSMILALEKMLVHFKKFYSDSSKSLIPVKSEFIVYDSEYQIAGMVDQLFFNKKHNEYQIFDWKTNKDISFQSQYRDYFKHPISHLEECEFNTYSLQLSIYKHIIEKNTNIKIGKCYIVWINEMNDTYKLYECKNMNEEFQSMLKNRYL